ncbi:MAG: energy-coupling factor transporter transmembrane protein EcfT [Lachnospiraceae bacterium]|nr:energy-coupling factor transporter transmembrane protein EcfT [Lachnospiraceae bacterium]
MGLFLYLIPLFLISTAWWYLILTLILILAWMNSGVPGKMMFQAMKRVTVFLFITSVFCFFCTEGTEVLRFGFLHITVEGMRRGAMLFWRLMLAVVASSLLTFTTTPEKLADGLAKAMHSLTKIGVPVSDIAMIVTIALRFIPVLNEEAARIRKAQIARGANFSEGNLIQRAGKLAAIFVPLFVSSVKRAQDLAVAMDARCYGYAGERGSLHPLVYHRADYIGYAVMLLFFSISVFVRMIL